MRRLPMLKTLVFTALFAFSGLLLFPSAVSAAKFYFNPGNASVLSTNCPLNEVAIMLDPQGLYTNAADVELSYNSSEIDLVDQNQIISGGQIKIGSAFESYRGNLFSGNKILLTGNSFLQNLTGPAPFGYIVFKPKAGVLTTAFRFRFDGVGATLDSNVAQTITNLDLLTAIENATFNFANIPCPVDIANDKAAPIASLISPPNQSTDNPLNSNVVIQIQDAATGVDLQSLEIKVNNIKYTINSAELSYSGAANDYTVTINPAVDLPPGQLIEVKVAVNDLANNLLLSQFEFNNPNLGISPDTTEPVITIISPADGSHNIPVNTNIELRIRDTGVGIDLNSVVINIDGQAYQLNSEGFSYVGSSKDYIIKINPPQDLAAGKKIVIDVSVKDVLGNQAVKLFVFNQPPQDIFQTITQSIFEPTAHPLADTIFQNTIIERFIEQNGVAAAANVIFTTLLIFNLLSFINFLVAPNTLLEVVGLLFGKRTLKTWGVVYDAQTKRPVPFAVVRLYVASTLTAVDTKVTDLEGRYGFIVPAGKYRVEVNHTEYKQTINDVDLGQDPDRINFDIRVVPLNNDLADESVGWLRQGWKKWRSLTKKLSPYLFTAGFMSAIFSVTVAGTIVNLLIFVLYLVLLFLSIPAIFPRQPKSSMIIDSSTDLRVPSAVVKIFDLSSWELIDSQLTSSAGLFDFWGMPGEYGLLVAARGYRFPSTKNADLPKVNRKYDSVLKVKFKKGNNHLKIYIDPISTKPSIAELLEKKQGGNLSSPFN